MNIPFFKSRKSDELDILLNRSRYEFLNLDNVNYSTL